MPNEGRTEARSDGASGAGGARARPTYSVELSIEELVLHGFAAGDGRRIGEAVERELSALFGERGVPPPLQQTGELPALQGLTFEMSSDGRPEAIGSQIALAIYGGFNR
ncbi:MAG TPA: hypothetical protein VG148_04130 [Pyrinomonadaceae bacterium]|nr:hypothetical protein [Pyrinomonadaceae bacterium]